MSSRAITVVPKWSVNHSGNYMRHRIIFAITSFAAILTCIAVGFMIIGLGPFAPPHVSDHPLSSTARPVPDDFVLPDFPPQMTGESRYNADRVIALGTSDKPSGSTSSTEDLKYAVILPTFEGHFNEAHTFFQSLKCLCTDTDDIDIYVIVSDSNEAEAWRNKEATLEECGETWSRFQVPAQNVHRANPKTNIINMYDILPPIFQTRTNVLANDTSKLLQDQGKFGYQTIKKLASALHFDFDYGLWLDSEAIVVQPFSFRAVFDDAVRNPVVWRSRMTNTDFMRSMMRDSAQVLGRRIESFGERTWMLENTEWIIEKAVFNDMVDYVEHAHNGEFWDIWNRKGRPFEILLHNMHIMARKLETENSIFSKYQVLETEREMLRFGMAPAFPTIEDRQGTGFLERSHWMLSTPDIQPNLSAFLRRYKIQLYRLEDLNLAPYKDMDKLLLETPLYMLCSGAPPLHQWWKEHRKEIAKETA